MLAYKYIYIYVYLYKYIFRCEFRQILINISHKEIYNK